MNVSHASSPRPLTPARIVALVLIAAIALGLGSLRLASEPETVSVPAGAQAGDLITQPCTYPTEDGPYDADCGTLVVAENPADADSPVIALPVVRIRARSATPREPIFRLEGGPGITNMDFDRASRFVDDRDLVLVGYRGVDGSVRLDCPEVVSVYKRSTDILSEEFFTAKDAALRACATRFADAGVNPSRYGLVQQIDDLEAARAALGYERVNLLSGERRHSHGVGIRVAPSRAHPPLGDDRCEPAGQLPVGPGQDRRADAALRRPVRRG